MNSRACWFFAATFFCLFLSKETSDWLSLVFVFVSGMTLCSAVIELLVSVKW